jgi:alpha-glucosidase (family GH31 glycosyl hydrolase)
VPLLPRRNLGVWFTRWYDYDAADVRRLVGEFERRALPLDVLVLDMNWHTKDAWTGYSFDKTLFPDPAEALGWLRSKGLAVAANLHDAEGAAVAEGRSGPRPPTARMDDPPVTAG